MIITTPRPVSIDAARWPDVATAPHRPVRAAITARLMKRMLADIPITVTGPGDLRLGAGGPEDPTLQLHDPDAFHDRLGTAGLIGFGEAYMAGDWSSDDLAGVLTVLAGRMATLVPAPLQRLKSVAMPRRPRSDTNTAAGARRNIQRHYDLSNDLFATFLDPTMSYSSGLLDTASPAAGQSLQEAQERKIDRLLDVTGVKPGTTVLEIGTGWGELALRAAARGARVTTVTLSSEQAALARDRIADAGLADRVDVLELDYRDLTGSYDCVVSVEMIEAIGADQWDEYFARVEHLLSPGGRFGLQSITMAHDRMLASARTYTWILKYIFPGGQIPSMQAIASSAARAGLAIGSTLMFGQDYAETLRRWRDTFESHSERVDTLGFDEVFRRMWSLYLAYSEAGFRSGYLDVAQIVLRKPGVAA
jgi:cyclopropane-fatty-acyl-phospholipid synthase